MPRSYRGKAWCFTLNNYTNEDEESLAGLVDTDAVCYVAYGREVGENGTKHLQGYVELSTKRTLTSVKQLGGLERSHLERRRGTQKQAIEYCRKDNDFVEYGQRSQQGSRRDLAGVRERLDNGSTVLQAVGDDFSLFLQYRKGLEAYRSSMLKPRTWKTYNIVLWGRTGTGKTRWVHYMAGDRRVFQYAGTSASSPWFDGYDGHELVLFDDFRGHETIRFDFLLRLLDRYPMQVPIKGGFREWAPRKIYLTSNVAPDNWYPDVSDCSPLWRRLDQCKLVQDPLFPDISPNESTTLGLQLNHSF